MGLRAMSGALFSVGARSRWRRSSRSCRYIARGARLTGHRPVTRRGREGRARPAASQRASAGTCVAGCGTGWARGVRAVAVRARRADVLASTGVYGRGVRAPERGPVRARRGVGADAPMLDRVACRCSPSSAAVIGPRSFAVLGLRLGEATVLPLGNWRHSNDRSAWAGLLRHWSLSSDPNTARASRTRYRQASRAAGTGPDGGQWRGRARPRFRSTRGAICRGTCCSAGPIRSSRPRLMQTDAGACAPCEVDERASVARAPAHATIVPSERQFPSGRTWPPEAQAKDGERARSDDAALDGEQRKRHDQHRERQHQTPRRARTGRAQAREHHGRIRPYSQDIGTPSSDSDSANTTSPPSAAAGHASGSRMRVATRPGRAATLAASTSDGSMPCKASATSDVTTGAEDERLHRDRAAHAEEGARRLLGSPIAPTCRRERTSLAQAGRAAGTSGRHAG